MDEIETENPQNSMANEKDVDLKNKIKEPPQILDTFEKKKKN